MPAVNFHVCAYDVLIQTVDVCSEEVRLTKGDAPAEMRLSYRGKNTPRPEHAAPAPRVRQALGPCQKFLERQHRSAARGSRCHVICRSCHYLYFVQSN